MQEPTSFPLIKTLILFGCIACTASSALSTQAEESQELREAKALFDADEHQAAEDRFHAIKAADPDHAAAHYYLGRIALAAEKQERAETLLQRAVELSDTSEHRLWHGRAMLVRLQAASMFAKATIAPKVRKAFAQAVSLDPSNIDARVSLGNYYLSAPAIAGGSKVKAREQAEAIVELDRAQGLPFLARVLQESGDLDGAIDVYRKALAVDSASAQLRYSLGTLYQTNQLWDEAFDQLQQAALAPRYLRAATYQIGKTGALCGCRLEQAETAIQTVIADPETADRTMPFAYLRLGSIREHQERWEEAAASYERALALNPDQSDARRALQRLKKEGLLEPRANQ